MRWIYVGLQWTEKILRCRKFKIVVNSLRRHPNPSPIERKSCKSRTWCWFFNFVSGEGSEMPSGRNGTIGRKKRLRGIFSVVGLRRRSLTPRLCRSHQLITHPGLILTCADAGPTPHLAGSCRVSPYSLQAISGRRRAGIPKSLLGVLFTFAPLIASLITERPASLPCGWWGFANTSTVMRGSH